MNKLTGMSGFAVAAVLSLPCAAEGSSQNLSPVLLDTKDGEGTAIGLQFKFEGDRKFIRSNEPAGESSPAGVHQPDEERHFVFAMKYKVAGTATVEEDQNPENLVDAFVDLHFKYDPGALGTLTSGILLKYETDQSFDNQQAVYGISFTYGKMGIFEETDFFGVDVRRGRVDPSKDKARQAALGTTSLGGYYRNELEVLYVYPVSATLPLFGKMTDSFEFNYRYYEESGAPAAIEAAKLDKFFLRTFRLNLKHDLFIAYSQGKLPFDVAEDEFFTLGFSYDLE
jgi:hypothetical protein